jgi:sporulation protein YlmC with PRC-barrel domain
MSASDFDVVRQVLDHELIDAEGMPCGMVDDVVLEGEPGAPLRVVELLCGPGAWMPRAPRLLSALVGRVAGRGYVRVPWSAVAHVGERIRLASTAQALGLGRVDRRVGRWVARIPGGSHAPE